MSIYRELDSIPEHRTQFAATGKREYIAKVNIPNMTNTNQHVDIEIPHCSRDLVIVPETVKIMFDLESTDKTRSIIKNVDRTLITKKVLMLDLKETDMIVSSDIYDTYRDLYLSEREHEGKLLKGIQSANGVKASVGVKKQMAR